MKKAMQAQRFFIIAHIELEPHLLEQNLPQVSNKGLRK
jgi:hypothetical protein